MSLQLAPAKKAAYRQRGISAVQLLFKKHFQSFAEQYEEKYARIYGRFRIKRITEVVEKFILCGDYSQGVARIQCTNPECRFEYFRPFPCKSFSRWNPHYHCLVLEGGFDEAGRFVHIPFGNVQRMSEYFRRVIIKFFLKKKLISAELATSLINWRHSGFSVDASVHIPAGSSKTREALSQYIARPPLSLKKITIEENSKATVISYTSDNKFFKRKIETFPVMRFLPELTQHIPPRGSQYIRRYGLYSSRTIGQTAGDAACDAARTHRMEERASAGF